MRYWIVKIVAIMSLVGALIVPTAATALAAPNPSGTGQPSQDCEKIFSSGTLTPQGFNTDGFNHATDVYAGSDTNPATNPKSVSQYDVACFQNSQP